MQYTRSQKLVQKKEKKEQFSIGNGFRRGILLLCYVELYNFILSLSNLVDNINVKTHHFQGFCNVVAFGSQHCVALDEII